MNVENIKRRDASLPTRRVLLASRAIESAPIEGGFVLLSDLARALEDDEMVEPFTFSSSKVGGDPTSLDSLGVFSGTGWNIIRRAEFLFGLLRNAQEFDVVHTAHVPTPLNVSALSFIARRSRPHGTKFLQTVTSLPDVLQSKTRSLLWGDHVVCQSQVVLERVRSTGIPASLIHPWPSPSRVALDSARRSRTRRRLFPDARHVVVFPGEFARLGVDASLALSIEATLRELDDVKFVLACRFDGHGIGNNLAARFPGNVSSVGETESIIEMIEAADLVIYPARQMSGKFQPPLVLTEAVQLGTPVLVSEHVDMGGIDSALVAVQPLASGWEEFGDAIARRLVDHSPARSTEAATGAFSAFVASYRSLYEELSP